MRIVFSLILALIGAGVTIKSEMIFSIFGPVAFAEKHLHSSGGSRFFYKLLGILMVIVGFVIMTNLHMGTMEWIGKNLFGAYEPPTAVEIQKSAEPEF